jgi:hypothetical protein
LKAKSTFVLFPLTDSYSNLDYNRPLLSCTTRGISLTLWLTGYQFEAPSEPAPPSVDDEARRREEEELQRALEISMRDKGGRSTYGPAASAGSSGAAAKHASGYVPARSPSPKAPAYAANSQRSNVRTTSGAASGGASAMAASSTSSLPSQVSTVVVTRVRALHTFEPTEPGELAFEKGEVIKVVDRGYKDWWRGQLKGRTGIFPVNYVVRLSAPTSSSLVPNRSCCARSTPCVCRSVIDSAMCRNLSLNQLLPSLRVRQSRKQLSSLKLRMSIDY